MCSFVSLGRPKRSKIENSLHERFFFIESEQVYTRMKHAETWYKGLGRTRNELSCVAPELYCERFVNFMAEHTR